MSASRSEADGHSLWRRWASSSLAMLIPLVVLPAALGEVVSPAIRTTIISYLIFVVLVLALQSFVGHSGVFSFGHVAFMAIGAYVTGALRIAPETKAALFPALPSVQADPNIAILAGALAAVLVAAVIGVPLMRLTGLVAGLATFGLLNIVYVVASNLYRYTGGSTGMTGIPGTTTPIVAGVWSLIVLIVAWFFSKSSSCLRLRATREDEPAARALGINVTRERTISFVLSAGLAGVAGGLYAQFFGTFNPEAFFLTTTFAIVAMLVVGGALSVSGAVVGAAAIFAVTESLRVLERGVEIGGLQVDLRPGIQQLGVAAAMLLILVVRPAGLTGGRELQLPKTLRRGWRRR